MTIKPQNIKDSLGRVVYYSVYPVLAVLLNREERSRVIIQNKNEILLVKSWIGNGLWELPGGGIHKNETPAEGAIREINEELGILINQKDLKQNTEIQFKDKLANFKLYFFSFKTKEKPSIQMQKLEISEYKWVNINELDDFEIHPIIRNAIMLWLSGS